MSTTNLRSLQTLSLIFRFVRDFLFGNMNRTLTEAGLQIVQTIYDLASTRLEDMEGQIGLALADGDYLHARDRVGRIALLGGRYIALLVAIRALDKIMQTLRRMG